MVYNVMSEMNDLNGGNTMETLIEIGKTYFDTSVPSHPKFVVETIKDGIAKGHYVAQSGPSYASVNQLREVK